MKYHQFSPKCSTCATWSSSLCGTNFTLGWVASGGPFKGSAGPAFFSFSLAASAKMRVEDSLSICLLIVAQYKGLYSTPPFIPQHQPHNHKKPSLPNRFQFAHVLTAIIIFLLFAIMSQASPDASADSVPAYSVKINTSCFGSRQPFLKEKTQKQYLPQYWQKCRMDQKRINPSCEDRLSELTTGQIDRIIDMEKIRTLLNDKKLRAREVFFEYDSSRPNKHPHVYEANFLAKINAIAIKRNIRHQKSEGFDEYFGEQTRQSGEKDKKASQVPYRYLKKYKLDSKFYNKCKTYHAEDDDEKSIESIKDEIDKFESMLESGKQGACATRECRKMEQSERYSSTLRWFNGMSNHYLIKQKADKVMPSNLERMPNFDISSYLDPHESRRKNQSFISSHSKPQSLDCGHRQSFTEPFVKYRINRIQRVTTLK